MSAYAEFFKGMPKFVTETEELSTAVIFRLNKADHSALQEKVDTLKIIKVRSRGQFARKIVVDYLRGRLVYLRPEDQWSWS